MLAELQRHLSDIYQVGHTHDVRDYLITDPLLAKTIGRDAMLVDSEETLLLVESGEELALSLFLDREMLERLEALDPLTNLTAESLDDLWKVLEGISHFNCVVWKASQDRSLNLLELELQGEIDKFVTTSLIAIAQSNEDLLRYLHGWLFEDVSFRDGLDDEQLDRYRSANDYAARFCRRLRERLIANGELAISELRRFYRLQFGDKISHIHSQAWASA